MTFFARRAVREDCDFAACYTQGDLASTGPSHHRDEYWTTICRLFRLDTEDLPWVDVQGTRVRYCIQAGIFRVRRDSAIVEHYLRNLEKLMDSKIITFDRNIFFNETVALNLAPFTSESSWSELPRSHNYTIVGVAGQDCLDDFEDVRALHYHTAMFHGYRDTLLSYFKQFRPDQLAWLQEKSPLSRSASMPHTRLLRRILRAIRERKKKQYLASCRAIQGQSSLLEARLRKR